MNKGKRMRTLYLLTAAFSLVYFLFNQKVFAEIYTGSIPIDDQYGGKCYLVGVWIPETKTCTLTKDIKGQISTPMSGVVIDGDGHSVTRGSSLLAPGVLIWGDKAQGVTVKNLTVESFGGGHAIYAVNPLGGNYFLNNRIIDNYTGLSLYSPNNLVEGNYFERNSPYAVRSYFVHGNIFKDNYFLKNHNAIYLQGGHSFTITGNTMEQNRTFGIYANSVIDFTSYVVNNNFINNGDGQISSGWDEITSRPLPIGGNYWSDYDTPEEGCHDVDNNYICDTPRYPNPFTKKYGDFLPWRVRDGWKGVQEPDQFFAALKNGISGVHTLYERPSLSTVKIKQFPNDWIVHIIQKTDSQGLPIESDGYVWYQIIDPTDGSLGWIPAKENGEQGRVFILFESEKQEKYQHDATLPLSTREERAEVIHTALDHYYNNTQKVKSLYSADDASLRFSLFKTIGFPKELLLAIIAQESSIINYNNEFVSYDYGHGTMQVTFQAWFNEPNKYQNNRWDNRGRFSLITNSFCRSIIINPTTGRREAGSDDYKKCYKNTETKNTFNKPYKHFENNTDLPIYKQYSNTTQSFYANIKDGLGSLREKYSKQCPQASITIEGYTFSCTDIEKILMVWGYNGFGYDRTLGRYIGDYLRAVAGRLENLAFYFPGYSYNNSDALVEKMRIANNNRKLIKLYSPAELQITDSTGKKTGLFNGEIKQDIPYSLYSYDDEGALILFPETDLTIKVVGTENETYGMLLDSVQGGDQQIFTASDLPIRAQEIHTYAIDHKALREGQKGITVSIDTNGDGTIERTITSGLVLDDITPPTISIELEKNTFVVGEQVTPRITVYDNKDTDVEVVTYLNGETVEEVFTVTKPGENTLEVIATDNTGNSQKETILFFVQYVFSGFLAPLQEHRVYQNMATIPVRFTLTDYQGNLITGADVRVIVHGEKNKKEYSIKKEVQSLFYKIEIRLFDAGPGSYTIEVILDDGTQYKLPITSK